MWQLTAENAEITASDLVAERVQLTARKAAALTRASNEVLLDSSPELRAIVEYDHIRAVSLLIDNQSLFGVPVYVSSQISTTETVGSSGAVCSWIAVVDMSQIVIGRRSQVRISYATERWFEFDQTATVIAFEQIVRGRIEAERRQDMR